jgi:aspartyl-tRNA(Asn)/glutamyl-tRNA(Gln) amidotransferase subunit A
MMTILPLTVTDAAAALRAGEVSSVDLTTEMLARADRLDPQLGTYVTRLDESALAAAERADKAFADGTDLGPYQGIPIGIKDILATADGPTTANSLILDRAWGEGKDGPVVSRLRAAGAVITGKLVTMEFAIGVADATKPFPVPKNPWNLEHWPGGSSSGTGNGVAAGLFYAGIGTDTGGSIRIPAAFNGTSGLMPTFGRVPKSGCAPLGYSLDHIGPLARSARDCAEFLQVIAGDHPSDESCVDRPVDDYVTGLTGDLTGMRIGVERANHFPEQADPAAVAAFEAAVAQLAELGAELVEVELPYYAETMAVQMLTMTSEALAYHRNDFQQRWDDYFDSTRLFVSIGALSSAGDFVQAQRVRRLVQERLAATFADLDAIVGPTAVIGAPPLEAMKIGEMLAARTSMMRTMFTGYWDVVGNPALVVPMGFTADGLPLSLQIAGRPFDEAGILKIGDAYQTATDWHLAVPPIAA